MPEMLEKDSQMTDDTVRVASKVKVFIYKNEIQQPGFSIKNDQNAIQTNLNQEEEEEEERRWRRKRRRKENKQNKNLVAYLI